VAGPGGYRDGAADRGQSQHFQGDDPHRQSEREPLREFHARLLQISTDIGDVRSLPRDRNRTISTRAIGISIERNCVSGSKDAAIATAAPPTGPDVFPFGAARQSTGAPRGG